jgi:hypothetical protein
VPSSGMTLELSDEYEHMDEKFQSIVPKTHSDLNKLMFKYSQIKNGS